MRSNLLVREKNDVFSPIPMVLLLRRNKEKKNILNCYVLLYFAIHDAESKSRSTKNNTPFSTDYHLEFEF